MDDIAMYVLSEGLNVFLCLNVTNLLFYILHTPYPGQNRWYIRKHTTESVLAFIGHQCTHIVLPERLRRQ